MLLLSLPLYTSSYSPSMTGTGLSAASMKAGAGAVAVPEEGGLLSQKTEGGTDLRDAAATSADEDATTAEETTEGLSDDDVLIHDSAEAGDEAAAVAAAVAGGRGRTAADNHNDNDEDEDDDDDDADADEEDDMDDTEEIDAARFADAQQQHQHQHQFLERAKQKQLLAALMSPKYYAPMDQQVRTQMRRLYSQVEALKKKLKQETTKRAESERHRFQTDEENLSVKVQFMQNLERVERELLKYRDEFQKIERRNDWLEGMREHFEGESLKCRMTAVRYMALMKEREMLHSIMLLWRFTVIQEKLKRLRLHGLQNRIRVRLLRTAVLSWEVYVDRERTKKTNVARASRFHERCLMHHSLQSLLLNIRLEKRKRELLRKLMVQKALWLAAVTFGAWRAYATSEKVKFLEESNGRLTTQVDRLRLKGLQGMQIRELRRFCVSAFQNLRDYAKRKILLRERESVVRKHRILHSMGSHLAAWREYVAEQHRSEHLTVLARLSWKKKLSTTVFETWRSEARRQVQEDNDMYVSELTDAHLSLRTRLARFISAIRLRESRLYLSLWHAHTQQVAHARKVLCRVLRSVLIEAKCRGPFAALRFYAADQIHSRKLHKMAVTFRRQKTKLHSFRGWQYFIMERNRTRLLSQKVVLDLQTRSLSRAFDSMGINAEDRKRAFEQEQTELKTRHTAEMEDSQFHLSTSGQVQDDVDVLRERLKSERAEWRDKYAAACRELEKVLQLTRTMMAQVGDVKEKIVFAIGDLKNPQYTDRYVLRKAVEEHYGKMLAQLDTLAATQGECERRYGRELATLKRSLTQDSAARDGVTDRMQSLLGQSRKYKDRAEEHHRKMLDSHESETRLQHSKFEALLQSIGEMEDMKESLVRENSEFEVWIKSSSAAGSQQQQQQQQHHHGGVDDGSTSESSGVVPRGHSAGQGSKLAQEAGLANLGAATEKITEEKVQELLEEAHEMEARQAAEKESQASMVATAATAAAEAQDLAAMEGSGPAESEFLASSTATPGPGNDHGASAAGTGVDANGETEKEKTAFRTQAADSSMSGMSREDQKSAAAASSSAKSGGGVTFVVRPDRVPLIEEGDTRKLEIEILRLRRKFERQEKQLRSKFEDDLEVWRRRYEHALRVLLEMEDWKAATEEHLRRLEQQHAAQVQDDRVLYAEKIDREHKIRHYFEEQLRNSEDKLHVLEDASASEISRLQGLVQYYETNFGVLKIKTVNEVVRKKQRLDAAQGHPK